MAGVPMPARDDAGRAARKGAHQPDRRHGNGDAVLPGPAAVGGRRQGARLSARPRPDAGDAAVVPARLCARQPQRAEGISGRQGRRQGRRSRPAGWCVHGDDIPVSYDRFRDRIMFPIPDSRGRIIAFGGRALSPDALAKYMNSPETELFHKGNVLYNFARARKAIAEGRHGDRRRRLYGRDRAGAGRLRERRGAARHGAHRKPARTVVAHVRRAGALLRRRPGRAEGGVARRRSGAAADPARTLGCASRCCPKARTPTIWSRPMARTRSAPCSPMRGRSPICCGCARRRAASSTRRSGGRNWKRRCAS